MKMMRTPLLTSAISLVGKEDPFVRAVKEAKPNSFQQKHSRVGI
jgi:hypothetical protein